MANVIIRKYNIFFDQSTGVQFNPVLDRTNNLYIGFAQVTDDQAAYFKKNAAFEVVSDAELTLITTGQPPVTSAAQSKLLGDAAALSADVLAASPAAPKASRS